MCGSKAMKRAKQIEHYHLRKGDQIPTVPVTIMEIMSCPKFERGVDDVRASRGYPRDYDQWEDTNDRWDYERGRQWARLVPRHVKLKVNGKITTMAMQLYREHDDDIL
jgi:hypothetical protein